MLPGGCDIVCARRWIWVFLLPAEIIRLSHASSTHGLNQRADRLQRFLAGIGDDENAMIKPGIGQLRKTQLRVLRCAFEREPLLSFEALSRFREIDLDIGRNGYAAAFTAEIAALGSPDAEWDIDPHET